MKNTVLVMFAVSAMLFPLFGYSAEKMLIMPVYGSAQITKAFTKSVDENLLSVLSGIKEIEPVSYKKALNQKQIDAASRCDGYIDCIFAITAEISDIDYILISSINSGAKKYKIMVTLYSPQGKALEKRDKAFDLDSDGEDIAGELLGYVKDMIAKATAVDAVAKQVANQGTKQTAKSEVMLITKSNPALGIKSESLPEIKKEEPARFAVLPFATQGFVNSASADLLASILSTQLAQSMTMSAVPQSETKTALEKSQTDPKKQCFEDIECLSRVAASLGVAKIAAGTAVKENGTYAISLLLFDTAKKSVDNRIIELFSGEQEELQNAIKYAAFKLIGADSSSKPGGVSFTFNVKDAEISIGETKATLTNSQYSKENMLPGKYLLTVQANPSNYYPLQTDIYVAPGQMNIKNFTVMEKPTPWYKTWWFWTITGTVVAGAAATTAVILLLPKRTAESVSFQGSH